MQCALKIAKFVTEQIPLFIYITVGGKIFSRYVLTNRKIGSQNTFIF